MAKRVRAGDAFELKGERRRVDTFRREPNDPRPRFESERIRVTHLTCSDLPGMKPYTFGTEPEWFRQRGLVATEAP